MAQRFSPDYQSVLLVPGWPKDVPPQTIAPRNGQTFTLVELYALLDTDVVEVIEIPGTDLIFLIDEEGKLRDGAGLNLLASAIWWELEPAARGQDAIMGKAVLCHRSRFE